MAKRRGRKPVSFRWKRRLADGRAADQSLQGAQAEGVVSSAPCTMVDDQLLAFQAELASIEHVADDPVGDGPSTPEETRFEDDDGTVYVWDSSSRKFAPENEHVSVAPVAAAAAPAQPSVTWSEADMVFDDDHDTERAMPSLADATAVFSSKVVDKDVSKDATGAADPNQMSALASVAIEREKARRARREESLHKKASTSSVDGSLTQDANAKKFLDKNNTSVYVVGLPRDVTETELLEKFGKCGVVKRDPDSGDAKVKIYRDEFGNVKGDALVTYLRQPSVELAVTLLDGAPLRDAVAAFETEKTNDASAAGFIMRVTAAKFTMKGDFVKKQLGSKKRKASVLQNQAKQALDWGGHDDAVAVDKTKVVVVLSNMFSLDEMFSDPNFRVELEEDVLGECSKFGAVTQVKVFTTNCNGVVTATFGHESGANFCAAAMHGRWFGGTQIGAALWDGKRNFTKETGAEETTAGAE